MLSNSLVCLLMCMIVLLSPARGQSPDSSNFYTLEQTYINPVLPGDHPDPTLLKVGDDFFHCGSSFHFTPYLPIYHSTDLVHWEVVSRVVPPSKADRIEDRPSGGIWQGAITYFYGSYWIYFSSGGQWFSKANSPFGPWSEPVQVRTNPATGNLGYDNSIFIDEGKPYMVIKNGQKVNRLQALGQDGQLTDSVINLDWINAKLQYSWAEGPVMCKRNGYYYYFPAGDVSGGQYVLRGTALSADSSKWERLGEFFKPVTDPGTGFRRPNHISAPFQLTDGSWWTIGQSYEKLGNDDWSGMGRQTSLYEVVWEGDRPWGVAPTTRPLLKPKLKNSGIRWRSVQTDYFRNDTLNLAWHFLNRKAAGKYSLRERKGWVRLKPDTANAHLLQKETDHYYTAVTKVELNPNATSAKAGLYLSNGNQRTVVRLYTGFVDGKKIIFSLDTASRMVVNTAGNTVWLKLERNEHMLSAYYSGDGKRWTSLGAPISAVPLDKVQPNYNSWVGTSLGLFAEGMAADFDFFICKDGRSALPATGASNHFGVARSGASQKAMSTTTGNGGWFMISGVELGEAKAAVKKVQLYASALVPTRLELWLDRMGEGKPAATIDVPAGTTKKWFGGSIGAVSGSHDVFVRFPKSDAGSVGVEALRFE